MADFLDELINISKEFNTLKNEVTDMGDRIMGKEPTRTVWNPATYKELPEANPEMCVLCRDEDASCRRCFEVCPVDAIRIEDGGIEILKDCRKCGLCSMVCPTDALYTPRYAADVLYRKICGIAATGNMAYVTCTRALGHVPDEAVVVLPCVGALSPETWTSILMDYPNIAVYLPLGICDKCRTTTGEQTYMDAICTAEEWSGKNVGLETEEEDLDLDKKHDVERRDFLKNMAKSAGLTVSKVNPLTARVARAYEKLEAHQLRFDELQKTLDRLCGVTTTQKTRKLTNDRQLLLTAFKDYPDIAKNVTLRVARMRADAPAKEDIDLELALEVVELCPTGALDFADGRFLVESSYCVGCDLCADKAPELLEMVEQDGETALYRFKPEAEKERQRELERKEKRAEERQQNIGKAKDFLGKAANITEKIGDSFDEEGT